MGREITSTDAQLRRTMAKPMKANNAPVGGRVTNKTVRPCVDELMIGGNRDVDREEASEVG